MVVYYKLDNINTDFFVTSWLKYSSWNLTFFTDFLTVPQCATSAPKRDDVVGHRHKLDIERGFTKIYWYLLNISLIYFLESTKLIQIESMLGHTLYIQTVICTCHKNVPTPFYLCSLPSHQSTPVRSDGHLVQNVLRSLILSTSDSTSTALQSYNRHVRDSSKTFETLYHSSFFSHPLCNSLPFSSIYQSWSRRIYSINIYFL